ncbi:hypothetical protein G6L37_04200 [Agrobacterium rubi]|nr:hypothetical protein [Agrobacterium rubi]NTF24553.1 hypothetical protein [Agrobacterium rubi]
MSCYEWERGRIKIPSADWAKTKAHIRDAMNRRQTALFEVAEKIHAELVTVLPDLKKQLKAKSINDWTCERMLDDVVRKHMKAMESRQRVGVQLFDEDDSRDLLEKIVVTRDPKTRQTIPAKLRKPQKRDYPISGNTVLHFTGMDCAVLLENDTRTAQWEVYENNHAIEHARASVLGTAFFAAMEKITWVKGTGGEIYGNNEYNVDSGRDHPGGGGSLVNQTFSMEQQKKDKAAAEAARRSSYGGYGYGSYRRW